jgi:uncharacterized protein YndB with AHSA1/START domain
VTHNQTRETSASRQAVWDMWSAPQTWPEWCPDGKSISLSTIASGLAETVETKANYIPVQGELPV